MERTSRVLDAGTSRRSFLVRVAVIGSAFVLAPIRYLLQPGTAYAVVCGDCGGTGACCDGYSEFCCVLYGANACPTGTFAGGWWKADGSGYCGGDARYYVDCHAECRSCGCANGSAFCGGGCVDCSCGCPSCNNRKQCCANFRYGQCNQQIACAGPIACRVATCTPPYVWDTTCTTVSATDQNTVTHNAACLTPEPPPPWKAWEPLGGQLTSAPAVASWQWARLDVFVRGTDNQIWHRAYDGARWLEWQPLGAPALSSGGFAPISAPAAISTAAERIDVFVRGPLDALWHKTWDGARWSDWQSRGGTITSAPAVSSWAADRIDVFARGQSGDLVHATTTAGTWSAWESLGGQIVEGPGAVSWGSNRMDVFVHGTDNAMWHRWYDGGWSGWESLEGRLVGGPDAASMAHDRLDVFVRGTDNAMWHRWWDGISWSPWLSHGGVLRDDPAAVSWGANRIDTFVRGSDDQLWHRWRE
jgi:hypothetical protein